MSVWDGLQETWSNLWTGIEEAWGGATATPEELERIDEYLGDDYSAIEDLKNTGQEMGKDGVEYLVKETVPGWVIVAVVALFAFVVFDN